MEDTGSLTDEQEINAMQENYERDKINTNNSSMRIFSCSQNDLNAPQDADFIDSSQSSSFNLLIGNKFQENTNSECANIKKKRKMKLSFTSVNKKH